MTALRFQTGGRHQTSPASLRGELSGTTKLSNITLTGEQMRETFPYEHHYSPVPSSLPAKFLGWGYEKYEFFQNGSFKLFVDNSFSRAHQVKRVQVIDKITAHQFGCESSDDQVKYPKESVIHFILVLH